MKKSALTLGAALLISASTTFAGDPVSFADAPGGKTSDGRDYDKKIVNCSGKSEGRELFYFKDSRKWCLPDESYCNGNMMKVAKKACRK